MRNFIYVVQLKIIFSLILPGFSNISLYVSKSEEIPETEINRLLNITTGHEINQTDYTEEFTRKYPLCNTYQGEPSKHDVVIDIDCQFPFEARYVLLVKDSSLQPSSLTLNDVQFKLEGM